MSDLILATTVVGAVQATGEIRAGGTDVQDRRRRQTASGPIVDISRIDALKQVNWGDDGGLIIGALVTVDAIARDPRIIQHYPGLAGAAGALATPSIRRMSSLGGSLLQRTRCWYYRNPAFTCYKGGGDSCPARTGDHRYGVCFDLGPCVFPHPSTLGMALMAYEAQIEVNGDEVRPIVDLYGDGSDPTRDHMLGAGEVLTHVLLPAPLPDERASYFRAISRAHAEWPLVEAIARLVLDDAGTISFARVGIGGVANVPLRLSHVTLALEGKPATDETFRRAAEIATEGMAPLPLTEYKGKLLHGTVYETLRRASQRVRGSEG